MRNAIIFNKDTYVVMFRKKKEFWPLHFITNFQNNEDIYSFVDEKNDKQDSYDVKMIEFSTQILLAITADGFLEC
jgi:hypothetical protein